MTWLRAIRRWLYGDSCAQCADVRETLHVYQRLVEMLEALLNLYRRKAEHYIRLTFKAGAFSLTGENITMNANPGQKIGFTITGKDGSAPLDLTNIKVSTSDTNVATVEGANNADNTVYTGTVRFVGIGACSLDAEDILADGRDIDASAGLNVVAPATMEIVLDSAGPVAGP